jgi:hypothetical protein
MSRPVNSPRSLPPYVHHRCEWIQRAVWLVWCRCRAFRSLPERDPSRARQNVTQPATAVPRETTIRTRWSRVTSQVPVPCWPPAQRRGLGVGQLLGGSLPAIAFGKPACPQSRQSQKTMRCRLISYLLTTTYLLVRDGGRTRIMFSGGYAHRPGARPRPELSPLRRRFQLCASTRPRAVLFRRRTVPFGDASSPINFAEQPSVVRLKSRIEIVWFGMAKHSTLYPARRLRRHVHSSRKEVLQQWSLPTRFRDLRTVKYKGPQRSPPRRHAWLLCLPTGPPVLAMAVLGVSRGVYLLPNAAS